MKSDQGGNEGFQAGEKDAMSGMSVERRRATRSIQDYQGIPSPPPSGHSLQIHTLIYLFQSVTGVGDADHHHCDLWRTLLQCLIGAQAESPVIDSDQRRPIQSTSNTINPTSSDPVDPNGATSHLIDAVGTTFSDLIDATGTTSSNHVNINGAASSDLVDTNGTTSFDLAHTFGTTSGFARTITTLISLNDASKTTQLACRSAKTRRTAAAHAIRILKCLKTGCKTNIDNLTATISPMSTDLTRIEGFISSVSEMTTITDSDRDPLFALLQRQASVLQSRVEQTHVRSDRLAEYHRALQATIAVATEAGEHALQAQRAAKERAGTIPKALRACLATCTAYVDEIAGALERESDAEEVGCRLLDGHFFDSAS